MIRYATRNNAFVPARTYVVAGDQLLIEMTGFASNLVPMHEISEVNLAFAPTRPERNRYRCTLRTTKQKIVFFNRTYRGIYDFPQTNPEYVAFVRALHGALLLHNPSCRFTAGSSVAVYALNIAILIFVFAMLVLLGVFLFTIGLTAIVVVKVLIILFYIPTALRWAKKNRPRKYDPRTIPDDLLPAFPASEAIESTAVASPPPLP